MITPLAPSLPPHGGGGALRCLLYYLYWKFLHECLHKNTALSQKWKCFLQNWFLRNRGIARFWTSTKEGIIKTDQYQRKEDFMDW